MGMQFIFAFEIINTILKIVINVLDFLNENSYTTLKVVNNIKQEEKKWQKQRRRKRL